MATWRTLGLCVALGGAVALWRLVPPPASAADEEVIEPEPDPMAVYRGRGKPPGWDEKIAEVNELIGGDAVAWERYVTLVECLDECHLYDDLLWKADHPTSLLPGGAMHELAIDFTKLHDDTVAELIRVIRSTPLAPVISPDEFNDRVPTIESGDLVWYIRRESRISRLSFIDRLFRQLAWVRVAQQRPLDATRCLMARFTLAERYMTGPTLTSATIGAWDIIRTLDELATICGLAPGVLGEEELMSLQFRVYELDPLVHFQRALHWNDGAVLYMLRTADHIHGTDASALTELHGETMAYGTRESHAPAHSLVTNLAIEHLHLPYVETFDVENMQWRMDEIAEASASVAAVICKRKHAAGLAWSAENHRRGAIVGIAAERFRLLKGRHPVDQSELVSAGFLEFEIPGVFGYELVIAPHGVGVMVYDIGPDEIDHGGRDLVQSDAMVNWYCGRGDMPQGDALLWSSCASWQLHERAWSGM